MHGRFIRVLATAWIIGTAPCVFGQSVAEVAKGVHLLGGTFVEGRQPDGNTVILRAPDGLIVVDTGRHREHTQKILDFATSQSMKPVAVINTHWHLDHSGGNVLLRREVPGVRMYASGALSGALTGFLADYATYLKDAIPKAKSPEEKERLSAELGLIEAGKQLAPDEIVTRSGPVKIAGKTLDVHLESPAVTAGDLWILDADSGVLIAGDLVTLPVPFLDTACPSGWSDALARVSKAEFKTLIPGHGPAMKRDEFERYRKAFDNLRTCAASDQTVAQCTASWLKDTGSLVPEAEHAFTGRLMDYYVGGVLRGDPARIEKLCE